MNIEKPAKGYITQYFDTPVHYIAGRSYHEALDIVTDNFEKIVAMFSGTIDEVIDDVPDYAYTSATNYTGYGNEVWVESDNGRVMERFTHNKKGSPVREGEYVNPGDHIATTGQTGYRFPDPTIHTHDEVYIDWIRVDPLDKNSIVKALDKKSLTIDDMSTLDEIQKNQEVILKTLKEHTKQIARLQKTKKNTKRLRKFALKTNKKLAEKLGIKKPKKK